MVENSVPTTYSIYNHSEIQGIRDFISILNDDDVFSIVNTATNKKIIPASRQEAIDVILLYTTDVERLFSYRRITSNLLSEYLHRNQISIRGHATKHHLIKMVINLWKEKFRDEKEAVRSITLQENSDQKPVVPSKHYIKSDEFAHGFAEWFYSCFNKGHTLTCTYSSSDSFSNPENSSKSSKYSLAQSSSLSSTQGVPRLYEFDTPLSTNYSGTNTNHSRSSSTPDFTESSQSTESDHTSELSGAIHQSMFCSNGSVDLYLINNQAVKEVNVLGASKCAKAFIDLSKEHRLTLSPNLDNGIQAFKSPHGLVHVAVCGTVYSDKAFVGVFEQEFGLVQSPVDKNWKIFFTKANFKTAVMEVPSLPPCDIFEIESL